LAFCFWRAGMPVCSVGDFPVLILMDNQSGAPKQSKVVSIPKIPVFAVTFYLL